MTAKRNNMDIKFQKEPKIKKIKIKQLKIAYDVPRDERFQELFTKHLKNEGVVLDEVMADISQIEPFSKDVEVPQRFIKMMEAAIGNGQKPEIYVYKKGTKYIMSDDYPAYLAYLALGWNRVPVSVLKDVKKP
jgi:hypothetical protein